MSALFDAASGWLVEGLLNTQFEPQTSTVPRGGSDPAALVASKVTVPAMLLKFLLYTWTR